MNRVFINYDKSEAFVSEQRARGSDVRWDGWDMVFWKPFSGGFYEKNGEYRNGRWGVSTRVTPDARGLWKVPRRVVVR